ncbi:MAG: YfdX family protein [Methylococcales bacterium]|nr:YfdX family protein [Methylococcales bacterium]
MKKYIHNAATISALILASSMLVSEAQAAATEKKAESAPATASASEKKASLGKQRILAEKNQKIVSEARDSILGTQQALLDLEKKESKAALAKLKSVSKKLDGLLAKNPGMAMVAADVDIQVFEFEGDENLVKAKIKEATDLLNAGKLQDARHDLADLASEMRVSTINIPLGSYPEAIKKAIAEINAKKPAEAGQILADTLNTLVEVTEVLPLPVLNAEGLLLRANELEHDKNMTQEQNRDVVLKDLDAAKESIKMAELLGYGGKEDYQPFNALIDDVKNNVYTEKSAAAWEKAKQALADLKNKTTQTKK